MGRLQERLTEVTCAVLNYVGSKIEIDYFYNEDMYNMFLSGVNCRQGMGLYDAAEELKFNNLNDGVLLIIQKNGIETAKYKYKKVFESILSYKDNSKRTKKFTFKIRQNEFGKELNYMDSLGSSLDFPSLNDIKNYLKMNYKNHKPIDWSLFNG
jgi:hypothetical protein